MFPDLEPGTAAAVCLARYAQEPLAEYCALWTSVDAVDGFGFESLFLDLHPLKHLIRGSKSQLKAILESCLVDAVCSVGVDINKAVSHDHYAPLLAFVGGLGPRKADALRREIRRSIKFVDSRDILLSKKVLGAVVYSNAAGFIKISAESTDMNISPLDNSRVHPECYVTHKFTYKLFASSQDIDFQNLSEKRYIELVEAQFKDSRRQLLKILDENSEWVEAWHDGRCPTVYQKSVVIKYKDGTQRTEKKQMAHELNDRLGQMDSEQYAGLLLKDYGRRRLQLEQIKHEVRFPWLDPRKSIKELQDEDLFTIITGESDYTLYVGLKVGCTVMEISDVLDRNTDRRRQRAMVMTDNGIRGYIGVYDVVDERINPQNFDLDKHLQVLAFSVCIKNLIFLCSDWRAPRSCRYRRK
jgi:transcription elongation factor SPT6